MTSKKTIKKQTDVVIFYWPHNRPLMHDGDEFTAQANVCRDYYQYQGYNVQSFPIPKISKLEKRQFIFATLRSFKRKSMSRIIFLCHGSPRAFAGFTMANIGRLGDTIYGRGKMDCSVILYCCLTGKNKNGVADLLSRTSAKRVIAHKTRGHTTRNPYKRIFNGGKMADMWPHKKGFRKRWVEMFKSARGSFIFSFVENFLEGK